MTDRILANKSTTILVDGITYPSNAANVIRNGSILGADCIIFCPIDEARYNELEQKSKKYFKKLSN